jgi:Inositol hexakisphosphate
MKSRLVVLILLFLATTFFFFWGVSKKNPQMTLILNSANTKGQLPRNFRICSDPWLKTPNLNAPSRLGLESLQASGSGQFSEDGFKSILIRLGTSQPIIIVDLRQESHGYANGIAISWYAARDASNVGKTLAEIEADEEMRLQNLVQQKNMTIQDVLRKEEDIIEEATPISLTVEKVATEKELTQGFKIGYFRIPVTDHLPPTKEDVDRFLTFVQSLPAGTWLHFHCEAGDGRTTTFLSLYDMIRNGKNVSFDDIIERQYLLGGINLADIVDQSSWKYPHEVDRLKFLQEFY